MSYGLPLLLYPKGDSMALLLLLPLLLLNLAEEWDGGADQLVRAEWLDVDRPPWLAGRVTGREVGPGAMQPSSTQHHSCEHRSVGCWQSGQSRPGGRGWRGPAGASSGKPQPGPRQFHDHFCQ